MHVAFVARALAAAGIRSRTKDGSRKDTATLTGCRSADAAQHLPAWSVTRRPRLQPAVDAGGRAGTAG